MHDGLKFGGQAGASGAAAMRSSTTPMVVLVLACVAQIIYFLGLDWFTFGAPASGQRGQPGFTWQFFRRFTNKFQIKQHQLLYRATRLSALNIFRIYRHKGKIFKETTPHCETILLHSIGSLSQRPGPKPGRRCQPCPRPLLAASSSGAFRCWLPSSRRLYASEV